MKIPIKKGFIWLLIFLIVFLLSQDYLYIKWTPSTSLLGLPLWLFWLLAIYLIFLLAFHLFSKRFWKA